MSAPKFTPSRMSKKIHVRRSPHVEEAMCGLSFRSAPSGTKWWDLHTVVGGLKHVLASKALCGACRKSLTYQTVRAALAKAVPQ